MRPLLGSYAAKTCAVALHHDHDPTREAPPFEHDATTERLFSRGREFETAVFARMGSLLGADCLDLSYLDVKGGSAAHVGATVQAMGRGVRLILGGRLPDDSKGGRVGKPDALLRGADQADGQPGYLPGDVKAHRTVKAGKRSTLRWSSLADPQTVHERDGVAAISSEDDVLQLAHYAAMLDAAGWSAAEPLRGAILGTSELEPDGLVWAWTALGEPLYWSFSRTHGGTYRSGLERYRHEFEFRHDVIAVAAQQTGSPDDPAPLVTPLLRTDCSTCRWLPVCEDQLDPDDPSLVQQGRLGVRQWDALRKAGVGQARLATLDADALRVDDLLPGTDTDLVVQAYLPEVGHLTRTKALSTLADAVRRASLVEDGMLLRRTTSGPLALPRADVEVDVDLEWHEQGATYLWGFLVDDGAKPRYVPFLDLEADDDTRELALTVQALQWLVDLEQQTVADGRTLRVFHYSHPEVSRVRGLLDRVGRADLRASFDGLVGRCYVDLHPEVKKHLFGLHGLGLKPVARALGFSWQDEDAGGLQSQGWAGDALTRPDDDEVQQRLLQYNADDVSATRHLRRTLHGSTHRDWPAS